MVNGDERGQTIVNEGNYGERRFNYGERGV